MGTELDRAGLWLDQAVGHHVEGDLDAAEASALTAKIKAYVGVTWILIHEAHARRADKALGYKSWAEYVKAEFDMSRAYAYRLVAHAEAVYELAGAVGLTDVSPMGDISERTTRGQDIEAVADEVERQSADLPADATDEDRADLVRSTLAKQTTLKTETTTTTFDPETGEVLSPTATSGSDQSDEETPDAAGPGDDEQDTTAPAPSPAPKVAPPPPTEQESRLIALESALNAALKLTTQWTDHEQNVVDVSSKHDAREVYLGGVRSLGRWVNDALVAADESPRLKAVQ